MVPFFLLLDIIHFSQPKLGGIHSQSLVWSVEKPLLECLVLCRRYEIRETSNVFRS